MNAFNFLLEVKPPLGFDEELFALVARAIPHRQYPEVLWAGMDVETITRLARKVARNLNIEHQLRIDVERPFARRRFRDRHAYFDAIAAVWEKQYSTFIVAIDWPKNQGGGHWSVLKAIDDDRVRLVDFLGVSTNYPPPASASAEIEELASILRLPSC